MTADGKRCLGRDVVLLTFAILRGILNDTE